MQLCDFIMFIFHSFLSAVHVGYASATIPSQCATDNWPRENYVPYPQPNQDMAGVDYQNKRKLHSQQDTQQSCSKHADGN